jgi:hypothetical protein
VRKCQLASKAPHPTNVFTGGWEYACARAKGPDIRSSRFLAEQGHVFVAGGKRPGLAEPRLD